jgi:transcriptional regulator with XRE-family HTH domain
MAGRLNRKGAVTVSQASAVAAPGVLGPGARGFKPEMDRLRERMRGLGFSYDEIAIEVTRRYAVRPRQAYRLAWGWTLDKVAERFNELAAREGTDPEGRAGMSSSHLCELERWPDSDRKPSVYVLCLLAKVYETDVLCLLDLADHESLPPHDRLVLMRRQRAETPFGERVLVLAEARGLSLRELARRVPCDASHLSKVVHGRKRPSPRVAARLDDALEAAGELVILAGAIEAAPDDGQPPGRRAADGPAVTGEGMTLTLPYVPARLVIEIAAPAAVPAYAEPGGGHLALVRGGTPGQARAKAAGQ